MKKQSLNKETLQERQEDLEEYFVELVETFDTDARRLAAEIDAAVTADDSVALREAAHALKSSCALLGADHASDLSAHLESLGRDDEASKGAEHRDELVSEIEIVLRELSAYVGATTSSD